MFGMLTGTAVTKSSKRDFSPPSTLVPGNDLVSNSLEPAIDGPPSPERIRAYTEQMKRSSLFGNNSRTNTLSSATSSFLSRESISGSSDNANLSRKSSGRSTASSMPSARSERPESTLFESIFARGGKKLRRENNARSLRSSGASTPLDGYAIEEEPARNRNYGRHNGSRRRQLISEPYNFQHITHTQQNHLPDLERTSRTELLSEFAALRASQTPVNGELKGIRAEDLHFQNFSSEALASVSAEELSRKPQPRVVLRKSNIQTQRSLPYAKSHDNLRKAPPRPPRSPLSPECPVPPPARTSSRTASVLFDTFDPLASTTIERPYDGEIRRPAPFKALPPPPTWNEPGEDFSNRPLSHAVTTPGDEAWPLTPLPTGKYGIELTDVQEEDEEVLSRRSRSRFSSGSSELRMSQSVPALRRRSKEQANEKPEADLTTPSTHNNQLASDSWELDIDWCYEHELEADDNYDWDQCTVGDVEVGTKTEEILPTLSQPGLQLHLQDEERTYRGRCRPSLSVPSTLDLPELSPMSTSTITPSDPCTPSGFLRRSPSQASSFKESHGFNLSPSVLIPGDFQSQMDNDALHNVHFDKDVAAAMFTAEPFMHSASSIDEGASSTASYRSSNFSRASASSSSTRISANSRGSQDSMLMLAHAAKLSHEHRSVGSASSLPELVPSSHRSELDTANSVPLPAIPRGIEAAPAPYIPALRPRSSSLQHRRKASLAKENGRKGVNHLASPTTAAAVVEKDIGDSSDALSPVAEFPAFKDEVVVRPLLHGRNISAPVMGQSAKATKGRPRAKTSVNGGSYMLFPQV